MKKPEPDSIERRPPIPAEAIEQRIYMVRGLRVMLDKDLAELYGVPTRVLNQAVKRNRLRLPGDFMFRLSVAEGNELQRLRSQFVTLKRGQHIKYAPFAFTQEGVAMLSTVLRSKRAVQVNIAIMRAFVKLREIAVTHRDLAHKLDALETKYQQHDVQIKLVFEAIRKLIETPASRPKRRIGFLAEARLRS
jgi:ORF6N domain-containing protein